MASFKIDIIAPFLVDFLLLTTPNRNVGILAAYLVVLFGAYIAAAESSTPAKSRGEFLVFRRGAVPHQPTKGSEGHAEDEESSSSSNSTTPAVAQIQGGPFNKESGDVDVASKGTSVFHWEDLCYDVKVKGGLERRLLDHVDGWVKPGQSTALMVGFPCFSFFFFSLPSFRFIQLF